MPDYRHALVVGKFYPPHRGHSELIRHAARTAARTTVVVMSSVLESIPLADRVAWLSETHIDLPVVTFVGVRCDAPVDLTDQAVWAAQVAVMRAAARSVTPEPIDVVVTSEAYGPELARRLDAAHIVEPRTSDGLSASLVRHDLVRYWDDLAPATRAGLAVRVVVVGAESTGTTTVARQLATHYRQRGGVWERTACVEEYGRDYSERLLADQNTGINDLVWAHHDFDLIAAEQTQQENAAAAAGSPLLICDTDALATAVWERRYLGEAAGGLRLWARRPLLPPHDAYLLTDHVGIPWQDDGLREGDLAIREQMTSWFEDVLTTTGQSWVLLTGSLDDRLQLAIRTVDLLLARRFTFSAPKTGPGFEPEILL